ncbi:MAG: thiol peroxidase [Bacteroidetes bacterium]|nr:MAG: thiol peroxidase [Bacteroidota bacterium]
MAKITLGGNPVKTKGDLPAIGTEAPSFTLVDESLKVQELIDYRGKKVVLNIFPSIDTGVCANSVRTFNKEATDLENVSILNISRDLPFAFKRFCAAEGIENVVNLSEFRDTNFSDTYNVMITDGGFAGLLSRAIVIINESGQVIYTEQVPEIGQDPNFAAALAALKS